MNLSYEKQIETMEKQLSHFGSFTEKVAYLSMFFDPDPEFSEEARNQIRADLMTCPNGNCE